jgi:hypothetical protein
MICLAVSESLVCKSGDRLVFVRLKNGKDFHQARFIRLASRAISVWLNPFRVLLAERVMNLMLKLNVGAGFAGAARKRVQFHLIRYW